jgi:hypothetical protein
MSVFPELYDEVIKRNYENGMRHLKVLTGYASSSFVHHLIHTYEHLHLVVILGMAKQDYISIWDHNEYVNLSNNTGRLKLKYYNSSPPIHSKIYFWMDGNKIIKAYTGSANLTWNGFREYQEVLVVAETKELYIAFPNESHLIDCISPDVFQHITMGFQESPQSNKVDSSAVSHIIGDREFVTLSLVMEKRGREVHNRSGLNWGQRPGREPNQAYVPIASITHKENPEFFPDRKHEFSVITDDGESFICVVAQDNDKALESSHDNSILGKYFRKRLNIPLGGKVETYHLYQYGRDSIDLYKIDDNTFYLDFSQRSSN